MLGWLSYVERFKLKTSGVYDKRVRITLPQYIELEVYTFFFKLKIENFVRIHVLRGIEHLSVTFIISTRVPRKIDYSITYFLISDFYIVNKFFNIYINLTYD